MTDNNVEVPIANDVNEQSLKEALPDEDLENVAGGGTFGDVYDALNESWTDIKKGFMDAWTD